MRWIRYKPLAATELLDAAKRYDAEVAGLGDAFVAEVEDTVARGLGQIGGVLRADDDVAELARAGAQPGTVDREREHVGRLVLTAVLAVELVDALGVDELE